VSLLTLKAVTAINCVITSAFSSVTDALSTMLRLLGEESEEASWLIWAWSRMDPIEPCDEE
jgi:hypothetical protein